MSEPTPPGRPSSHRATGASRALGRLAAPLTALAVVVIVVVLLIWINGRSDDSSTPAAGPPAASAVPPTPSSSPSHTPLPTSSPTKVRKTPVPAPHRSRHQASPSASPPSAPFAPVEVLNNSRITGLAHHVAAEVESRGWTISQIGNLRGKISETTVYFPAGDLAAAQHLQGEFGSIQRVLPQSEAGLDSTSLVLVVTRFWTD
jgi:hypothetical protein